MRSAFLNNTLKTTAVLILLSCCKGKDNTPVPTISDYDEKALLSNFSSNIILPAYTDAISKSTELKTAINSFIDNPTTETLTEARTKWNQILFSWQSIALFQIGPANDITLKENLNTYPADTALINSNINNGGYNLESVANFSAKGLQSIDYLLNGIATTDNDVIIKYTTDIKSTERKTYLKEISDDVYSKIDYVNTEWENSYTNTFNNATGVDIGSSIGLIVNELNVHYERRIRDGKVAIPSGARTFTQTPLPEKSEAYYYNQISRDLLIESLNALENLYKGNDGEGLDDYLDHEDAKYNDAKLSETIENQFEVIQTKVSVLSPSIAENAINNQNSLLSIFDEMQFLSSLLKVEMTNALEVEITYQDSDGD